MTELLDTGHFKRSLRRKLRNPRFALWYAVTRWQLRRSRTVIDVDELANASASPEFADLTKRADARINDMGIDEGRPNG